ncbi:toprim domain-containing protein [Acidithiobacillus ferrooxidans]|uniref:toprim domain-containing protein n=1 Tax=Acidithiobacillus ferrooxidans TaxID=920 RepID=UPI00214AB16C|nr:toprim domain-containing protein [Acidithiobacillus ferrooxidans]MCR2831231.1 toprim domain-containing protein [Acidithiobacillus ferrooxidans]
MNDHRTEFFNALQSGGVGPASPSALVADGLLHRHRIEGDKPGSLNGWHVLHLDSPASGAGGSWKAAHSVKWCSKRLSALTASERALLSQRIEQDRKRAQEAQEARHRDAAAKAIRIWTDAAPASPDHPYLLKKQIMPGIARQSGASLVLPVVDFSGALHGLQFIDEQGGKRFISGMAKQGHFIPTGKAPDGTRTLYIAEGWATAATIQAMRPNVCTIAACDAGNLPSVATAARRTWGGVPIVIAPDFDKVGQEKGREACTQVGGHWLPTPADLPTSYTDWNDWRQFQRQGVTS